MATSSTTQRATAEINFGEGPGTFFKIGNRTVHQFWHLYSSHCRHLLLAPQRRPDTGLTAWTWREAVEKRPVTAVELTEVRRRLAEASRSLNGGSAISDEDDDGPAAGAASLEAQVRASVSEMIAQLIAQRDSVLVGFVCRAEAGLMLHSWGAASAAAPQYPDTQNGEISGLLMVGDDRPIGVVVALETPQGTPVARVKSDSNGHFRFPSIAPGNYRVRILERSDFPANGLAVTIEHESVTGLELRSVTGESPVPVTAPIMSSARPARWSKRPLISLVVLLLLLGIGGCVWRMTHATDTLAAKQNQSVEWQSAKDQLAAADAKATATDDHKVGADGAWSSLTKAVPIQKIANRHPSPPSTNENGVADRAPGEADDSALGGPSVTDAKALVAQALEKSKEKTAAALSPKSNERRSASSEKSAQEKSLTKEEAVAPDDGGGVKPKEDRLAKSFPAVAPAKRSAADAAMKAPLDESAGESVPAAGGDALAKTEAPAMPANAQERRDKSEKTKSPTGKGAGAGAGAPGAEAGADEGSQNATPDSAASAASGGLSKSASAKKSKQSFAGSPSNSASAAPVEQVSAAEAKNELSESTQAESGSAKSVAKSPPPKKSAGRPASSESNPEEESAPQDSPVTPPPAATPPSAKKAAKPSQAGAAKVPNPAESSPAPSAASAEEEKSPTSETSPAEAVANATPPAKKKTPAHKAAHTASPPAGDESEPSVQSASPPLTQAAVAVSSLPVNEDMPLVQQGQIRASVWKLRLLQDQVLPTRPLTAAEDDAVEAMRKKMLQSRRTQIPATFQQPQVESGFILELPPGTAAENNPLRWDDHAEAENSRATVQGNRAELAWSGNATPRGREFILRNTAGRVVAQVGFDASGALVLKAPPGVKASYWVGVERSLSDDAAIVTQSSNSRFDWRLLSGGLMPAAWLRDDRWHEGRGLRLEIPLDATSVRVRNYGIALMDQLTGWALACDVALQ